MENSRKWQTGTGPHFVSWIVLRFKDGDDFYGKNVILASRVAGEAVGGEILVSSLLRQLVESSTDASLFSEPRELELKGLAGTHTVFTVAST